MNIKIFADGSDKREIFDLYENNKLVAGFTTNPSLMKKAGVTDYSAFIKEITQKINDLPISFEVFADDDEGMIRQAEIIADYGRNINVKIPITNTKGEYTFKVIENLLNRGINLNITAVFTHNQINELRHVLPNNTQTIVSIFAGRISDTGRDPVHYVEYALTALRGRCQVLWASTRHVYNIYEAGIAGCHIITATPEQIKKLSLQDKDLTEYSLETVKMFYNDAVSSGFSL
jgi:transaldolase